MDVPAQLEEIFRMIFDDENIQFTRETTASDIPGWDSNAHINLMFTIEQTFGVQFSNSELGGYSNVGELIDAVEKKIQK